jgi:hypothetical protein
VTQRLIILHHAVWLCDCALVLAVLSPQRAPRAAAGVERVVYRPIASAGADDGGLFLVVTLETAGREGLRGVQGRALSHAGRFLSSVFTSLS